MSFLDADYGAWILGDGNQHAAIECFFHLQMKIQITSNTTAPQKWLNDEPIKIDFGYQYGFLINEFKGGSNSFLFKILAFLEKSFLKPNLDEGYIQFTQAILETTKKYAEMIDDKVPIDHLRIQLNFNTKLDQYIKRNSLYKIIFKIKYHKAFRMNSNIYATHIFFKESIIILGSGTFFNEGFCADLKNHIGIQRAASLVLLHEIGHGLKYEINKKTINVMGNHQGVQVKYYSRMREFFY